jgi:hypothetical protein
MVSHPTVQTLLFFLVSLEGMIKEPYFSLYWFVGAFQKKRKALPGFFLCIFSSIACLPEETRFHPAGSSAVEGTSQAVLDSSDQWKVRASLSLFLKSENIPALLYLRKAAAIFNLFPRHTRQGMDLKLQKGLRIGPSPIHNGFFSFFHAALGISKIIINQSRSFCMVKPSIMGFLYPLAWA